MSTANPVPEQPELSFADLRETLRRADDGAVVADAFRRLRAADGFSHARSMAFLTSLIFVQAVIALVGLAHAWSADPLGRTIVDTLNSVVPGATNLLLREAVEQARSTQVETATSWIPLVLGTLGAVVTGTTLLGQLERALNRTYGVERDRPTLSKYARAAVLCLTAGLAAVVAFGVMTFGREVTVGRGPTGFVTAWNLVRWPLAAVLFAAATAAVYRWAPRRRQPRWTWLMGGAIVSVGLFAILTAILDALFGLSSTFGETYGPLAGLVALSLWSYAVSLALLLGGALAAQAEAVRAGVPAPSREAADVRAGWTSGERPDSVTVS
jgi:YihY family inner membrane protein